jgi:hypothetical protein
MSMLWDELERTSEGHDTSTTYKTGTRRTLATDVRGREADDGQDPDTITVLELRTVKCKSVVLRGDIMLFEKSTFYLR